MSLCAAAMCTLGSLQAQDTFWEPADSLNSRRLMLVGTTGAVGFTGAMIGLNNLWYANEPRSSFHFFNDNADWLQMDKAGHAFSGYQISRLSYQAVRWSGVSEKSSVWAGAGFAMLFLTGIEVLDGFSDAWGFSVGDAAANVAGSALFVGQQLAWKDQRISLKYSYSHSGLAHYRPETLGASAAERMLKDYNGQTYWLSANPSAFMQNGLRIAPWLNVALGYSAQGMLGGSGNPSQNAAGDALPEMLRYRQYFLSLDVDFTRIQTRSGFLRTMFSLINVLKFPAPALELSQGNVQWHWLYY